MFSGTNLLLRNRCSILRYTSTKNAYGEKQKAYSPLAENVKCRLLNAKGKQLQKDKQVVIADFQLMLPFNQDVKESDQIQIDDQVFEILFIDANPGNSNHNTECLLRLVRKAS